MPDAAPSQRRALPDEAVRPPLTEEDHLNIIEARSETMAMIEAGNAVIWQSGSGLGKSQVSYSMFEELRDRDEPKGIRWGFGSIFAATQTPPDLIGYQFKGERTYDLGLDANGVMQQRQVTITDPSVPLWMMMTDGKSPQLRPAFMFDKCFLLIDEYGQGEADVKRAIAEIFLNGGTSPWYLPPGSVRIACTNQGARYGVSKDFDFCIARRALLNIEGNIEITLRYMDKPYYHQGAMWQTTPVVKAWAASHPEIVFESEPKEQGPWCNPRQLCSTDRYLQTKWKAQGSQDISPTMMSSVAGLIGMPAATSLLAHLEFVTQLPLYQDVVSDPQNTPVPQRADLQMLMAYQLAGYTQVPDLAACITYIQRLPKDLGITYITSLLRRDYKGIISQPAMQAWISKNASLVSIISSLANS